MVKVNEDFYIDSDPYSYILKQKAIRTDGKNKGEEYLEILGYYTSFESAIKGLIKYLVKSKIGKSEIITLKEAVKEIKNTEKEITGLLK